MKQQNISIIISLYNEEEGVYHFWNSLKKVLSTLLEVNFELIWVNDGSIDNTQALIDQIREEKSLDNIKNISIEFSKNFGHESAMIAGIDNANGDAIICIDSDGQHPPEEIPAMIEAYNKGNDIVLMQRLQRNDSSYLKRNSLKFFIELLIFYLRSSLKKIPQISF